MDLLSFRGILVKTRRIPLKFFLLLAGLVCIIWYVFFSLPTCLFHEPFCTVIEDRRGALLGAKIAADGQWRFPAPDSLPARYEQALLVFEDKRFYRHPGVDFRALGRALYQNVKAGKIVSGGSTISMQVIRMSRMGKPRNMLQKSIEIVLSTRLELRYSKKEILALYGAHAPFGGNVRGIEAASWRYFGRKPDDLTWAESALLAVLPNSPAMIHPGKNRSALLGKRNRLLTRLYRNREMDSLSWQLALKEPLPDRPAPLPDLAPHLLEDIAKDSPGKRVRTSLDATLQQQTLFIVQQHQKELSGNGVFNAAVLILDVETGEVLAYIGNSTLSDSVQHGGSVDVIKAGRSTGSILKPLLFASMLNDGEIMPGMLVPDYPTRIGGFSPKNYDRGYDGAVPARRAISRSLNVPAVRLLQQHGVAKFHFLLKKLGLTTLPYPPEHYGLTLILGGADATLWDLCGIYASMSRVLNHFYPYNGQYDPNDFHPPVLIPAQKEAQHPGTRNFEKEGLLSAASIWETYEAMVEVNRPDAEGMWQSFDAARRIAWKTGTSFGNRDGWSIGTTPRFVVGVWTGNASGEGRPLLTGLNCAAPVLFDIFRILPGDRWFNKPWDEMVKVAVCKESGYRPSLLCEHVDSLWVPVSCLKTRACPYHVRIHLSPDGKLRVSDRCMAPSHMLHVSWFVLSPGMEWYYRYRNPSYKPLPPWKKGCEISGEVPSMELIYPRQGSKIYIPREIEGEEGMAVFEAVHRNKNATIYWHLDNDFIGSTSRIHQVSVHPAGGLHTLTLIDQNGEVLTQQFEVLEGKAK